MKKNVLVISSSPRKGGNSDTLCDEFIKGAQSAGHNTEKIFLRDKKIHYCTGCGVCYNTKKCSQKDDMDEILDKMIAANVIVLATPVYFYTMCGQLKTMIDRCCSRYTQIVNKDFYYIITAADPMPEAVERVINEFGGFMDCLTDPVEKDSINGLGVWNKGDINGKEILHEAFIKGKNI